MRVGPACGLRNRGVWDGGGFTGKRTPRLVYGILIDGRKGAVAEEIGFKIEA